MKETERQMCVNIEVLIVKKLGISTLVTRTANRYWIIIQSIKSLHSLMYELTAYEYEISCVKEEDRVQEYIVKIEQKDLRSKINIWQTNLPIY